MPDPDRLTRLTLRALELRSELAAARERHSSETARHEAASAAVREEHERGRIAPGHMYEAMADALDAMLAASRHMARAARELAEVELELDSLLDDGRAR